MRISKNIKKNSFDSIKANSLEALIAAIYLDSNFSNTYAIVKKLWNNYIKKINLDYHDPKSKLQEWSLKTNNTLPVYEVEKKEGRGRRIKRARARARSHPHEHKQPSARMHARSLPARDDQSADGSNGALPAT